MINLLIDWVCSFVLIKIIWEGIAWLYVVATAFLALPVPDTGDAAVINLTALLLYYIVGEALFGRTLGKLITRTRVVSESGGVANPGGS